MADIMNNPLETCAPEDCASCSSNCGSRQDLEKKVIKITTDAGETVYCRVMLKYPMEGRDYIALMPLGDNPDGDIWLFRLLNDGKDMDNIEDREEYSRAAQAFGLAMEEWENRQK